MTTPFEYRLTTHLDPGALDIERRRKGTPCELRRLIPAVIASGYAVPWQIEDAAGFRFGGNGLDWFEALMPEHRRVTALNWPKRGYAEGSEAVPAPVLISGLCRLWLLIGDPSPTPWTDAYARSRRKERRRLLTSEELDILWWRSEARSSRGRCVVSFPRAEACEPHAVRLIDGRVAIRATNRDGLVKELIGPPGGLKGTRLARRLLCSGIPATDETIGVLNKALASC